MTYADVYNYLKKKANEDPPFTRKLVSNGYKQTQGGYILEASKRGIENPSQNWHLLDYCKSKIDEGMADQNYRFTPCGELLVYMAEASNAVDAATLEALVFKINNSDEPYNNRRYWNKRIKDVCWDKINLKLNQK